jgi:hypothetical protein
MEAGYCYDCGEFLQHIEKLHTNHLCPQYFDITTQFTAK